jgi:hypothetical protein
MGPGVHGARCPWGQVSMGPGVHRMQDGPGAGQKKATPGLMHRSMLKSMCAWCGNLVSRSGLDLSQARPCSLSLFMCPARLAPIIILEASRRRLPRPRLLDAPLDAKYAQKHVCVVWQPGLALEPGSVKWRVRACSTAPPVMPASLPLELACSSAVASGPARSCVRAWCGNPTPCALAATCRRRGPHPFHAACTHSIRDADR